jgi:hypothetical protein
MHLYNVKISFCCTQIQMYILGIYKSRPHHACTPVVMAEEWLNPMTIEATALPATEISNGVATVLVLPFPICPLTL